MSRSGYLIVDVDAHYLEPISEIADYVDEPWRTRIKGVRADRLLPSTLGDRMLQGRIRRDDVDYGYGIGVTNKEQIITSMKNLDVDAAIIVANRLVTFGHVSVRDLVVALAGGYIDYMLDKVADPAHGIYTMPIVPWQDPEASAAIVERVGNHPAVVGVCFMTSGANPPLGDLRYDPIYRAAQHHGLPVVFHGAPGLTLVEGASPADGFQRLIESHSIGFAVSNMIQLTSLLMQGVPERYPDLKFVFQECGIFWVPMMMYRLDEYYLKRREEAPLLKRLPSEYILDRFYFDTQPMETPKNMKHLEAVFDMVNGSERFMFGSDYPHFDFDDAVVITRLPFLDRQAKANILAGNALRVFNFAKGGIQPWQNTSSPIPTTSHQEPAASSLSQAVQ